MEKVNTFLQLFIFWNTYLSSRCNKPVVTTGYHGFCSADYNSHAPSRLRPLHTSAVRSRYALAIQHCTKLPQTAATANARRTGRKRSFPENGKVSKGHLSFTFDRASNRGLDIRIDFIDSRLRIFLFSPDGDFSLFFFNLLDLSRFVSSRFGAVLEPKFAGVGVGRKCASSRSNALARASSWCLRCFGLLSSVDTAWTQGRAPLPARVLGILWTAVGWEGAKFQRRSRSGPSNCECY